MCNEKLPSSQELLDAHDHMWSQIYSFVSSMCLKCAVELGIPDILHKHNSPVTLTQLTKALNIDEAKTLGIYQLMRFLVHAKFFTKVSISEKEEEEEKEENKVGFMLTPAYRPFLTRDNDLSLVSYIEAVLCPDSINPSICMSKWFRSSDYNSPFSSFHGKTLWEFFAQSNQKMGSLFREGMGSDDHLVSRIVPKECKAVFEGLELMVDVGGGTGYMAKAITDEFPNLKCIVFDLPQVVEGLNGDDKVTFVGGSMFESIPPCDAVFFKFTLHNWNDEDCLKVLGKCKEAIKHKGGKVIVIDMVVGDKEEDQKATETQLIFDVLELFYFGSKERTEKDWAKLFSEAGFTSYKITPLLGIRSLIEVFP